MQSKLKNSTTQADQDICKVDPDGKRRHSAPNPPEEPASESEESASASGTLQMSCQVDDALSFITAGVACNCITGLDQIGLLDRMVADGHISDESLDRYRNPPAIKTALLTLIHCGAVTRGSSSYALTPFGQNLAKHIGLITVFFSGYNGLVSCQSQIMNGTSLNLPLPSLLRSDVIAQASASISQRFIEPAVLSVFDSLDIRGTICDLGCGSGKLLKEICKVTGCSGLGLEINPDVAEQTGKEVDSSRIEIETADVTKLKGVWEDVSVLVQCHVLHEFSCDPSFPDLLSSFHRIFPNHQYLFYIDTVAADLRGEEIFPGFDYVHGLLGVQPATYDQTCNAFRQSDYDVKWEYSIPHLPNTYMWVLLRQV